MSDPPIKRINHTLFIWVIKKCRSHPSINKVKSKFSIKSKFSSCHSVLLHAAKFIKNIVSIKTSRSEIDPFNAGFKYVKLPDCTNNAFDNGKFSDNLLLIASVTPVDKIDEPTDKENFTPASGLSLYLTNRDLLKLY